MDNGIRLILKAYDYLDRLTPVIYDCGSLCDSCCCRGDSNTGMLLFPYEEQLIDREMFTVSYDDNHESFGLAVCKGECNRKKRPLACRLYPFFPVINNDGTYDLRADIRGISSCPVLRNNISPDYSFSAAVRKIARLFDGDEKLRDYIIRTNDELDEILSLLERVNTDD